MGLKWFLIILFILLLSTFCVALSLEPVLGSFKGLGSSKKAPGQIKKQVEMGQSVTMSGVRSGDEDEQKPKPSGATKNKIPGGVFGMMEEIV
jgi:hypothetical protein